MKTILASALVFLSLSSMAADLPAEKKAALDKQVEVIKSWAANKTIVDAVKASNNAPESKDMTQDKWAKLTVLDPAVRSFTKNAAAEELKKNKGPAVAEAFLNNAEGTKVAFLGKTSNWSHKGKPKHDDPMAGKTWVGKVEVDESSGKSQIQVSVPVADGGKNIGSLVVGFSVDDLK
tara:strand:+ start:145221 stop:145751 length:531 start_codon:yes stop_codon:yes gene_type:complete